MFVKISEIEKDDQCARACSASEVALRESEFRKKQEPDLSYIISSSSCCRTVERSREIRSEDTHTHSTIDHDDDTSTVFERSRRRFHGVTTSSSGALYCRRRFPRNDDDVSHNNFDQSICILLGDDDDDHQY